MDFCNRLNFTSSNEDGASEIAALAGAKHILCLTGSGGRALDLLLTGAERITALDMNRSQNALLALKMAAIARLDYQDYLGFIGVIADRGRLETLERLAGDMPAEDARYWRANRAAVAKGVWFSGLWERVLCANAKLLKLLKGRKIEALFAAPSIDAQAAIWERNFDGAMLRLIVRLAANRFLWTHIIGEPGGAFLPSPAQVAEILAMRFQRAAGQFLFRDSDFAALIFRGRQNGDRQILPVHMRACNYQHIRDNLKRIRIVTGRLDELPAMNLPAIDGFSLSDFGSYCTGEQYRACWQGILAASAERGIFCERLFMADHKLPFSILHIDEAESARLSAKDTAIIYNIRVGKIEKQRAGKIYG